MIVATLRGDCSEAPGRLQASYFTGFNDSCLYRIRVMCPGWEPLPPDVQDRVAAFLEKIQFSPWTELRFRWCRARFNRG